MKAWAKLNSKLKTSSLAWTMKAYEDEWGGLDRAYILKRLAKRIRYLQMQKLFRGKK